MEYASFVIGTTSGLISVAQTCLHIARAIDGIKSFQDDAQSIYTEYNFEQTRLRLWISQVLGVTYSPTDIQQLQITEQELPRVLTSSSPINLQAPLQSALNEIQGILRKFQTLLDKYGGKDVTNPGAAKELSLARRVSFQTKIYKEGGKEEMQKLLVRFRDWNDRLSGIVESRMRHHLISNMHVELLSSAATDAELQRIQTAAQSSHPDLSQGADFMRRLIRIDDRVQGRSDGLKVAADKISPRFPPRGKDGSLREIGTIEGRSHGPVLQEWKLGRSTWGAEELTQAEERVDQLASKLRLENKPKQLRCLDLVAYALKDGGEGDRKRLDFCFMYSLPPNASATASSGPVTLQAALSPKTLSERKRPTLAERFNMAVMLAESILEFHVGHWLHKAVCSSNVLFFRDGRTDQLDFAAPFVAGFEFARPDAAAQLSIEDAFGVPGYDMYCHPDLARALGEGNMSSGRPRYQRQYDIYGLGVVLLELGCWMSLKPYVEKRAGPQAKHEELLVICNTTLPSRMGNKYKNAVYACLTFQPDDDKSGDGNMPSQESNTRRKDQLGTFVYKILDVLRGCHCSL